ncbi:DEAD/DEAH box helicase [Bacillus sp. RAR_GA_16]|uniref:DEAD/DEAH box helicase n=1 Tax=Bacillus sp. RAR_GA_16 TaxID=2876774 RepID=UPI001CCCC62D|nr:DEAD/DEAH box helicase [Bacillus sp. RAR_GA_16]MCA0174199.1 DEAD/DEAH box helicase [Bacillus sp. RAR_GA_16]
MKKFQDLGLSNTLLDAVNQMGFEETTPIQAGTIPLALEGKDVIGQAQTGTGKTASFGIPMIEKIDTSLSHVQGIILAPTRELAVQVAEELNRIGQSKGVRALPIYGGQSIVHQIKALKKRPQLVVATPGRLIDHMERKTIRLSEVSFVVLDEADEMLNMGFIEDIEKILKGVPEKRQTLLFSATMPKRIAILAEKFMTNPETVRTKSKEMTVPSIEQHYYEVRDSKKFDILCRLLDTQSPELAIVFARTKKRVDEVSEGLKKRGYMAEGIHGDLPQGKRDQVIKQFKDSTIDIMVATDVAARGLDISGVTHVYNFDIPQDPESYVHRIGRTGRAGKSGLASTFITPREYDHLKVIEKITKKSMQKRTIPSFAEAMEGQQQMAIQQLQSTIEEQDHSGYRSSAEQLLDDHDSVTLLSAALKLLTKEPDTTPVKITEIAPLRAKKAHNRGGGNRNRNRNNDRGRKGGSGGGYRGDRNSGGGNKRRKFNDKGNK